MIIMLTEGTCVSNRLNDPCGNDCEAPYSFKHIVSLSENSDNFNVSSTVMVLALALLIVLRVITTNDYQ